MSLYTLDEICEGCQHAVEHDCCGRFCRCRGSHELETDGISGTCPYHELESAASAEET